MGSVSGMASTAAHPVLHTALQRDASILVVDDEEGIQRLLVSLLESEGYRVRAVGSAREALAALKAAPASLLMTDVKLPDRDGIELLQEACEFDRRMIGVVMTGFGSIDLAVQAMKAGAAEFLMKPFINDVVVMTVNRLLDLYRLRAENAVLKEAVVRAGGVRLHDVELIDFSTGHQFVAVSGPSEYEQGLAEGERRERERVVAGCRQEQALLVNAIRQLEETRQSLSRGMEADVTALAFSIATRILRETMAERQDVVAAQVKAALATIHDPGVVTVRTHPDDVPVLEAARAEFARDREPALLLQIEGDASLPRGSCLVETMNRLVDASLDTQLLRLGDAIRKRGHRESR